jgi:hypothetical protein
VPAKQLSNPVASFVGDSNATFFRLFIQRPADQHFPPFGIALSIVGVAADVPGNISTAM